jgi:hypothetical protein
MIAWRCYLGLDKSGSLGRSHQFKEEGMEMAPAEVVGGDGGFGEEVEDEAVGHGAVPDSMFA